MSNLFHIDNPVITSDEKDSIHNIPAHHFSQGPNDLRKVPEVQHSSDTRDVGPVGVQLSEPSKSPCPQVTCGLGGQEGWYKKIQCRSQNEMVE